MVNAAVPTARFGCEGPRRIPHEWNYRPKAAEHQAEQARRRRALPPFLLVAAGVLFISATDDELQFVDDNGMDHVTYLLIMFSIAFILYAFILALIHLYCTSGRNTAASNTIDENIELNPRSKKWHPPFSAEDADAHIIGEDDE